METVKMVEVTRNGAVESVHQGTAVLINSSGEILKAVSYTHLTLPTICSV